MTSIDAFLESYYRRRPVNATFTGIHEHDDRLPDWSPAGLDAQLDELRRLRSALAIAESDDESDGPRIAEIDKLRDVAARDRALAIAALDVEIAEQDSRHFERRNPSLAIGEAVFGIVSLITRRFAPAAERAVNVEGRLRATAQFLDGTCRSIVDAVPDEWRARALRECDGADALVVDAIPKWIASESIESEQGRTLLDAAAIAGQAFDRFRRWLRSMPAAPSNRYGCGTELFDSLLARGHWCERTRSELQAEAEAALDEALALLGERARKIARGGWPEVQARLADRHPTPRDYIATYERIWRECRERAEAHHLVTWPDYPIRYRPIPHHTRAVAPHVYYLFYRAPAPFDTIPVHEYVVTPVEPDMREEEQERRLRTTNTSVIKLNHVVHHGAIGHHVQNYYAYHGASKIGRIAAVDCASRIGLFCGGTMAEGWACYATDLMDEVGFLTPDEAVAQQHTRARLLARAVADIGLHEGSMTFDDAVALYRDRIGMSVDAARGEACKNSMFPATAIMYWLGTRRLHDLRHRMEHAEGAAFSLQRFHDRVLSFGSIPVPLVARILE